MMLTASPFIRRLRDLTSILEVVHDTSLSSARGVERSDISDTTVEDFHQLHEKLVACGSSYLHANAETRVELYGALDPRAYSQLMTSWDDAPTVVRKVVPALLAILGLRRVTGQTVRASGKDEAMIYATAYGIKVEEEDTNRVEAGVHATPLDPLPGMKPLENPDTKMHENIDKRRRLQTATNNSTLDKMYKEHAGDIAAFAFYYNATYDGWTPMPLDRIS
ncbi:hypothetical protein LTR56_025780 [Elasticomyces elasticus]|nr:hypothetical protein LTR56_025780 [Elasticomyces elasticus]